MDIFFKECIKSNTACVLTLDSLAKTLRIKDVHAAGRKNVELSIAAKQKQLLDQPSEDMAAGSTLTMQPENLAKRTATDSIGSDTPIKKKCLTSKSSDLVVTTPEIITSKPTTTTTPTAAKSSNHVDNSASKPTKLSDEIIGNSASVEDPKSKKSKKNPDNGSASLDSSGEDAVVESKSFKKSKKARLAKEQEEIELAKTAENAKIVC